MKKILLFLIVIFCSSSALAQFSDDAYKEYLNSHKDMTVEQLLNEYPAGLFKKTTPTDFESALYSDSIDIKYNLTEYEKELIRKHGFMVTERQSYETFHAAFEEIYNNDLPVYVSSDAILYAVHWTYEKIFKRIELNYLYSQIKNALDSMHKYLPNLQNQSTEVIYQTALRNMDVYLTVGRRLIGSTSGDKSNPEVKPYFSENQSSVDYLINLIESEKPECITLFSKKLRKIDFSQFKPRGYYTNNKESKQYFKTMIWLGRIEVILTLREDDIDDCYPVISETEEDVQKRNILAALIVETAIKSNAIENLNNVEKVLNAMLGRQDNINCQEVDSVMKKLNILNSAELVSDARWKEFQEELLKLSSANQLYNSQIIYSDPFDLKQAEPPSEFLLIGQRPILDGFITGNVVYDKVIYNDWKVLRMLPSTLDILFALGNDAAIQLQVGELKKFPYSSNLAALRYLISAYDNTFWESSCYTNWLNSIRMLNPPPARENLPLFMQTAAWWQKSMNTQLSSWAQLRHDFILYAKQPYTTGAYCSFPYSYVEPVPEFFRALATYADKTIKVLEEVNYTNCSNYFTSLKNVCDTLAIIAEKEIKNEQLTPEEITYLKSMIRYPQPKCNASLEGWYCGLFSEFYYHVDGKKNDVSDYPVADVHTAPTDADGNEVGWVLHGGTGKINTAVIVAKNHEGKDCAFIGPVMSYYECVTSNYQRLTDEEWETFHSSPQAYRPNFTNLYLAGKQGEELGEKTMLFTDVEEAPIEISNNLQLLTFPNPFSTTTTIVFTVPPSQSNKNVELNIYDMQGRLVNQLINEPIPAGNYSSRWDGIDSFGNKVEAGVYLFVVKAGVVQNAGKASLIGN